MSKTTSPVRESKPKPRAEADLRFDSDAKVQPQGFNSLGIDDAVTITLTGKIKSLSSYVYSDDDGSKNICVELKSCLIGKGDTKETGTAYQSDKD